jgi:hypothetical protein
MSKVYVNGSYINVLDTWDFLVKSGFTTMEFDESPFGKILDEIHKKFCDDIYEAVHTASRIATEHQAYFQLSKTKKR